MIMLEDSINEVYRKYELSDNEDEKELYNSIYHHLLDYKEVLNKAIELTNEINNISNRWELVKKANEN